MALTTVPASLSATALTLTTAAQPNITSVGTLTGLTVSGNIAGTLTTAAQTNITSVGTLSSLTVSGALNGTLSTAAQPNITSLGTLTSLTVDDITINGSTISDGGTLTLDVAGELHLDADDGIIRIRDAGGDYGMFQISNSDFIVRSMVGDKDLIFKGNDGGSVITALTLDMSEGGKAIFSGRMQPNEHIIFGSSTGYLQFPGASSRAWAMASQGGTAAPGTNSATFGFHHWSGSAWSNPINITASGKLCIGTDNPDRDLHIKGSGSDVGIQIEKTGAHELRVAIDSTGPYLYAEGTAPLRFYQNNAEIVRISGGLVGIGKTPAFASLEIEGDKTLANNLQLQLNGATNTNKQLIIGFDTSTDESHIISQIAGSASKPLNLSASKVKIGSIAGGADGTLAVKTNSNTHAIAIEEASGSENYQLGVTAAGGLGFYNSGSTTPSVVFSDADRVGINTATPQKTFHVEHAAGASEGILICGPSDTSGHTAGILLRAEGGEANSSLRAKGGIFFERTGTFGVGKLHLANNNDNDNPSATIADANLTLDGSGVGLHTTSPQAALDINGSRNVQYGSDGIFRITKNNGNDWSVRLDHGADDYGILAIGNGSYAISVYNQPASAHRARFNYNGELYLNGGSSALYNINSDVRLKEEISDAPSQWELVKGLPLQRFKWKDRREGDKWSYGFIAQEVEKTNPEFVEIVPQEKEDQDNGVEDPEYKTVAEGQIHERALAALQEAMKRIEALEAEVKALKGE